MKVRNKVLVTLYRIESRVGITPGEARALLIVSFLLVGGVSVDYAVDLALRGPADSPVQIVWPDSVDAPGDPPGDPPRDQRIGINAATSEELQRLPGVGPAIAERIVDYRARYGPFGSVEELTAVKGIGPKTFEKLKPLIKL